MSGTEDLPPLGMEEARTGHREAATKRQEPEERKTRRSRLATAVDEFGPPEHMKKPGMDYYWATVKVMKEAVDDADLVALAEDGWEPVRPTEMPGIMPNGYKGNTIDRRGLRLFKRPMYLTEESRKEDALIARQQREAKLAQALGTPNETAPRTQQQLNISIGPPGSN